MGLRSFISKQFSTNKKVLTASSIGINDNFQSWYNNLSSSDYKLWVYACANALANEVANIKFSLEDVSVDPVKTIKSHPILETLANPNKIMTQYNLMHLTSTWLTLYGEAYWYLADIGNPDMVLPLYPDKVTPFAMNGELLSGYRYMGKVLSIDRVVRFALPDPFNYIKGKGNAEALNDVLLADRLASARQNTALENNAIPSGALKTDSKLQPEDMESLKSEFGGMLSKDNNVAVFENGITFEAISTSLKELELIPMRKEHMKVILGVMRTSPDILGMSEQTNRATAEANQYTFAMHVIKPQMQLIADSLNKWLKPRFSGTDRLKLTFANPVPKDKAFELKNKVESLRWRTINEIRAEEARDGVEYGDEIYMQLGMAPLNVLQDYGDRDQTPINQP